MNETKSLFPGMQILGGAGNKQNIKSESATQKIKLHVGMKVTEGNTLDWGFRKASLDEKTLGPRHE